ncbi:hypothetical protein SAMN05216203_3010 [Marinobacter daqiaonensis]|uniref:Uncharacterized protein n=1 Tax=Marinobacter daqiaonensis TaxID=650891 RepID=A0A1I6JGT2_9GAMM|nr:hypothetical protein SAMN05216203_3010 [Marinobacter daqiaonensis]
MDRRLLTCIFLLVSSPAAASSFAIKATYSTAIGLPIPDENGDMITSVGSGLDISSRTECLSALRSELVEGIATGYGLEYGAHHVVINCSEYWEYENCPSIVPGCIGSADFGRANHIQVYYDGAIIEPYLRFSNKQHEVIKTVMYGPDGNGDGNLDIVMGTQVQFSLPIELLSRGVPEQCSEFIQTEIFQEVVRQEYFSDKRTRAYKVDCFQVGGSGRVQGVASKVFRRSDK